MQTERDTDHNTISGRAMTSDAKIGASEGSLQKGRTAAICDVVCLSTVDWDFLWGRHQEISARFADDGHRVVYVEPLGIRSWTLRDVPRMLGRIRNRWRAGSSMVRCVRDNVWVYSPLAVPVQDFRPGTLLNRRLLGRSVASLTRLLGLTRPIVWAFYATQAVVDIVEWLRPRLVVYDCIDAIWLNAKGVAKNYTETEGRLMERADVVFASSRALYGEQQGRHPHVYLLPPGVDAQHFSQGAALPQNVACIPRPRICFFGGIDERLDQGLLVDLARSHPPWNLVLIGPIRSDVSILKSLRNVEFLDAVSREDLPSYLHAMDVLIIPYLLNAYTTHVFPNKIYECLAVGKPTVATNLPALAELRDVVAVAETTGDFIAAVEEAVRERDPSLAARRQAVAQANSWAARYQLIQDTIAKVMREKGEGY